MLLRKKKKMHPLDLVEIRDALDWIWIEDDLLPLIDLYKLSSLIQDDKLICYFLQFTKTFVIVRSNALLISVSHTRIYLFAISFSVFCIACYTSRFAWLVLQELSHLDKGASNRIHLHSSRIPLTTNLISIYALCTKSVASNSIVVAVLGFLLNR